jgi:DNA-directed RNA polymerase specialized sigma24 family protein
LIPTLRETIAVAEAAASGDSAIDHEELSRMVIDLGHVLSGEEDDRAYLAVIVNSLDLKDEALSILEPAADDIAGDDIDIAALRNMQGVLVASDGQYGRALEILQESLSAAQVGTLQRTKILVNLAGVSLRHGSVTKAVTWLAEARDARDEAGDAAIDVLLASVEAEIARLHGDTSKLNEATSALAEASKSRIAEVGSNHPQALTAVANLAAIEFERAYVESSSQSQETACEVLEITSQRLAAELGADNPQTLISIANFLLAELMVAFETESTQNIVFTIDALEEISRRIDLVLGSDHPQSRTVSESLTLAKKASGSLARGILSASEYRLPQPAETSSVYSSPFHDELFSVFSDPRMRRLAVKLAGDRDLAEELLQETVYHVMEANIATTTSRPLPNLREIFSRTLRLEASHLRMQLTRFQVEDISGLMEEPQERGRHPRIQVSAPADEEAIRHLTADMWLTRFNRNREQLKQRVAARSDQPDLYRELIVTIAGNILLDASHMVASLADSDTFLRNAYPEWFNPPGYAADTLHQRRSRARSDVRGLLREIISRDELF